MRNIKLFICLILTTTIISCSSEKEKLYSEIKKYENTLFLDDKGLNDSIARLYVEKCDNYVNLYKNDANSPELLYKSAEVLSGLSDFRPSIRRFQKLYSEYPNYNKRAESIFICGFIYENHLMDIKNADYHYRKFIREYPKHKLINDANNALANLGKSPEELVKEFQQKESASANKN